MELVTVIDPAAAAYAERAQLLTTWLLSKQGHPNGIVEVFLVGTAQMDKNVLAFPANPDFPRPDLAGQWLGEIHLNPTHISAHGEDFDHMLVHGFLHLLGYDHEQKNDRITMETHEQELLAQFHESHRRS